MDVILIAAVTHDGFIARHSNEIITWSKDLHLFKKQTFGYPVIMGSNTFNCLESELDNREVIVFHRNNKPREVIEKINSKKCFVAGGGITNKKFYSHLTHLYITPHPLIFGSGIKLFQDNIKEPNLLLENVIVVDKKEYIFQYQYKILENN
jgi:dihydrofolate reductase